MTKYSKKICKITKNKTKQIKRRKNSLRIKKLHGGSEFSLEFTVNNVKHKLTKKRTLFGGKDAGNYTLRHGLITSIAECNLPVFIRELREKHKHIMLCLYMKLVTEHSNADFHFKSLYAKFNVDDVANLLLRMTINEFSKVHSITILNSNPSFIKIKPIYDALLSTADIQVLIIIYKDIPISEINLIYKDIPISKINPELPSLIKGESIVLGRGSFGTVYSVVIESVEYALKKLKNCETINTCIEKMNSEVIAYNTISSLVCDNGGNNSFCNFVSTYFDYGAKYIYVLMENCGSSLYDIIQKDNEYAKETVQTESNPTIYKWLKNIAVGLQCMHDNKYVHLDIKPDNITIIPDTKISKLIDFGLIFNLTNEYLSTRISGSAVYMSPEQLSGKIDDITKCDIYSLGITFIECAFALHYPIEYREACLNGKIFYSILRYDTTLLPALPSQQEITLDFVNSDGSITQYTFSPNKSMKDTDNKYSIQDILSCVDNIFKLYPLFKEMIITDPTERCTIDKIIKQCDSILSSV
jgi:hypothetical protein